jgi:hypothetical protein
MTGEYLYDIPGAEVPAPEGRQYFSTADGRSRRIYQRGSPEYLHARQAGLLERLPALVPAPADAVEEAEDLLGCRLLPLLRCLYLEIGNGDSARDTVALGARSDRCYARVLIALGRLAGVFCA